jgi:agmatine deiminase
MSLRHLILAASAFILGTSAAIAADDNFVITTGPDGGPVFPEGVVLPRYETAPEIAWRKSADGQAWLAKRDAPSSPPPTGVVHCTAEYEPVDGIVFSWHGASISGLTTLVRTMIQHITTTGNARVYLAVNNVTEQNSATTTLNGAGVDMSKVSFIIRTTDSIWLRDYGPRYIYEGDVRAIVDHTYNRPRPNDNTFPVGFGTAKKHKRYDIDLIHGGGNFHLDANNKGFATRLINNENSTKTESTILNTWLGYQGLNVTLFTPFPTSVDSTQHLDMWVQVIADDKVMVSDWPLNSGSTQDNICDAAAVTLAGMGYTVTRIPAYSVSGTHYTYANVVMCNDLVLIPSYTNVTASAGNAPALAAWQAALPGKTIVQVPCQSIVTSAGVMHCIVMHMPPNKNGVNPGVYVRSYNTGGTVTALQNMTVTWSSDDDVAVSNVDILLSTDSGATWPTTIASGIADTGTHTFVTPDLPTTQARIRVVARDASANTGFDINDQDFTIQPVSSSVTDWANQ